MLMRRKCEAIEKNENNAYQPISMKIVIAYCLRQMFYVNWCAFVRV